MQRSSTPDLTASLSRRSAVLIGTALLALAVDPAFAQSAWPAKPVKIVVPYGPGGAVDVVTRKIAQKLTEQTGQSFYIENKAGGTGTIGAAQVAKAEGDGYTLMANDTTFSLLPHIFKKLPFDPSQDLQPVSAFVFSPMALAVNASSRFSNLQELLAAARKEPNQITYGTGGPGTTPHFASEALGMPRASTSCMCLSRERAKPPRPCCPTRWTSRSPRLPG